MKSLFGACKGVLGGTRRGVMTPPKKKESAILKFVVMDEAIYLSDQDYEKLRTKFSPGQNIIQFKRGDNG